MPDQNKPATPQTPATGIPVVPEPSPTPQPPNIPTDDIAAPLPPAEEPAGSAAPPLDIPPVITTPQKPPGVSRKVIATILGLLVVVGGITAGVVLVRQQQIFKEKAKITECSPPCQAGETCQQGTCVTKTTTGTGGGGGTSEGGTTGAGGGGCTPNCYAKPCGSSNGCGGTCTTGCVQQFHFTCQNNSCVQVSGAGTDTCSVGDPNACKVNTTGNGCPSGWSCDKVYTEATTCQETWPNSIQQTCKLTASDSANGGKGSGTCCIPPPAATTTTTTTTQTLTEKATPTLSPGVTAQCLNIKVFDTNWSQLTATQLSGLAAGSVVRFTVSGQTSTGTYDKARFVINGTTEPEVTQTRPGSSPPEFYYEYAIPAGITSFSINAQLHHSTYGWF